MAFGVGPAAAARDVSEAGAAVGPVLLLPSFVGVVVWLPGLGGLGVSAAVEYLLEPLQKLEVVLVFALDEFLNFDVFVDVEFGEGLLQYFEVGDVLVVELGLPVDLGHGVLAGVQGIDELAVDGPCPQLLDLAHVRP